MNYKIHSAMTIFLLLGMMVFVGVMINDLDNQITGAVIAPVCECQEDIDCDDADPSTTDICLYADDCESATCLNE